MWTRWTQVSLLNEVLLIKRPSNHASQMHSVYPWHILTVLLISSQVYKVR